MSTLALGNSQDLIHLSSALSGEENMCVYHRSVPRPSPSAELAGRAAVEAHQYLLFLHAVQEHEWAVVYGLTLQKHLHLKARH